MPFIYKVQDNPRLEVLDINQIFKESGEESKKKHNTLEEILNNRIPMICHLKNRTLGNILVSSKK